MEKGKKILSFQKEEQSKKNKPAGGEKMEDMIANIKSILPKEMADKLEKAISDEMAVPPKVAIIGKAGVGKTSTINNIFNVEWQTSETTTGTTMAQTETFQLKGEGKLSVVDMPGLGDSIARDREFVKIYKEILPEVDVVLYIIQADDRGLGEDERIIRDVILPCAKGIQKKMVIGVNKVDLLGENEGFEWDDISNLPSEAQEVLIDFKCEDIVKRLARATGISKDRITYYSAIKRYRLYHLLYAVINAGGQKGWKFSVDPKDWTELMDPEIREEVVKIRQAKKSKNRS